MIPFAADYPLLEVLWTISIFFLWVMWIFVVISTLIDNFARDHSGWAKAAWTLSIIFLPLLGVLMYLISRPATIPAPARAPREPTPGSIG